MIHRRRNPSHAQSRPGWRGLLARVRFVLAHEICREPSHRSERRAA